MKTTPWIITTGQRQMVVRAYAKGEAIRPASLVDAERRILNGLPPI
jgi:hypothetical protein